jgi:hypothetical protein
MKPLRELEHVECYRCKQTTPIINFAGKKRGTCWECIDQLRNGFRTRGVDALAWKAKAEGGQK